MHHTGIFTYIENMAPLSATAEIPAVFSFTRHYKVDILTKEAAIIHIRKSK